ncbi:peptidoglycan DD-metalloendopeptidase family protein [Streptomyces sp. H39-S7]|uniref:peptidoglycan DD-metalloendopeptidase family protein n=1 Tax=Streptomyces sp. H39-S7 TaxID=3004357 RepID=UPI0022AE6C9C|nr:peptidoglycan DD-metalloendopeptidase family protein [Streptomyces sp. H39-S7]MCZ4120659.1 peptidoglycan DD-metalloendopeptidase family protein [Streptomyces sp. H39-S7]
MNDRHPSGYAPDYGAYGYDPSTTGSYQNIGTTFADGDPLFGAMAATSDQGATGSYAFVPQPAQHGYEAPGASVHETGSYDASGFWQAQTGSYPTYPEQPQAQYQQQGQQPQQAWDSGQYPAYGYNAPGQDTGSYPTGTYEAMSWDTGLYTVPEQAAPVEHGYAPESAPEPAPHYADAYPDAYGNTYGTGYTNVSGTGYAEFPAQYTHEPEPEPQHESEPEHESALAAEDESEHELDTAPEADLAPVPSGPRGGGSGSRRKRPAKRSALLTIAVPSVAVMGVAACAAAAISDVPGAHATTKTEAAAKTATNAPVSKLDTQLAGVTSDADDFATRASRTQERIDLKDREVAAKKAKADAAARKEALRPKFLLPVSARGLSAYYGQSGVNWMALHTGIDFPVDTGTPVSSVTDGTIRTQWNNSYGNMAIVTAADGTETWYCHLSSTKIRSGKVKAGQLIAYSGDTGNTTGPHLHFEVRPQGGSAIDPMPWLRSHGLDPR